MYIDDVDPQWTAISQCGTQLQATRRIDAQLRPAHAEHHSPRGVPAPADAAAECLPHGRVLLPATDHSLAQSGGGVRAALPAASDGVDTAPHHEHAAEYALPDRAVALLDKPSAERKGSDEGIGQR